MGNDTASKFKRIYNSLPPEAQKEIVDKHLTELLNSLPKEKTKKVVSAATRLQKKYSRIPELDIKGKKKELRSLLTDLRRDRKRTFLKEMSRRGEIFSEIIDSVASWIVDIWKLVFEHKVCFSQAHAALLYIWEVILELGESSMAGGCKCDVNSIPVELSITNSAGKCIKRFSYPNIQRMDRILLWMWRELFVSMLAANGDFSKKEIPDMLGDIEDSFGWRSLSKMIYGGSNDDDDDEDDDHFFDDLLSCFDDEDEDDDDDDEDALTDCDDSGDEIDCICGLHAHHWSSKVNEQRYRIRELVETHLCNLFKSEPSPALYLDILDLSTRPKETTQQLMNSLSQIATSSSSTFAATLAIYAIEYKAHDTYKLLESHSYLIRPQDAPHYQAAVLLLVQEPKYRPRALKIIEKELQETVHSLRLLIETCFRGINTETSKAALQRLLKLQLTSQSRTDRLNDWVDSVITPNSLNPMAFAAAMMMGFPPDLDDGDDYDIMSFLDLDPDDPDLADLRDQFRPNLRSRFEGWVSLASDCKGGQTLLAKLYIKTVQEMPYISAADVSDEMLNRLSQRPTKEHVADALEGLAEFMKLQKAKFRIHGLHKYAKGRSGTPKHSSTPAAAPPTSVSTQPPPPSTVPGGLADVD
ncbi:hypothetical protein EV361DRAFT_906192 [Lentinula raphanica]|uniref:Uncharacterized protein n=1 Tax=Lentinula raphanica TaxID=153919 RepID=A0AA38UIL6_9AGAR|nr:hypothetical protein F5878DRAFT_606874 [Lentinula raphanica]KAJ3972340.1 hypothetical protein EV361DRAFT_906192 [Lentinula raphanica]